MGIGSYRADYDPVHGAVVKRTRQALSLCRGALLALWFGVWYAVGWLACLVVKVVLYGAAAAAAGWRRAW